MFLGLTPERSFLMQFIQAQSPEEIRSARELFEEYASWVEISLCFQNFDKELAELPGAYAPLAGRLACETSWGRDIRDNHDSCA